jgi:phytoene desaturase
VPAQPWSDTSWVRPTAIVIGSGFGGLAAALRLAAKGFGVTVLEKLDGPGGRAYTHKLDGYTFDAGPTIVTVPQLFDELWALFGKHLRDDVRLTMMDPFYRIRFDDGTHFDYSGDPDKMRAEVQRISPEDVAGYEKFLLEAEQCYQLGFVKLGAVAFESVNDLMNALPAMMKTKSWRTLYGIVSQYIKSEKLRKAFSLQSLLIGGNPFSVTCIYSLVAALERRFGVHWAMGGTGELVRGMVKLLQNEGGLIRYGAEVKQIVVEQGRAKGVLLANGEKLAADLVVSNTDTAWMYKHLIAPEHRKHWTDKKIARGKYSMSLFVWYFGCSRQYTDVPHHMMILGPRYKALLEDIFKRKVLAEDFSLYLHRPTATDSSMAPKGHDTFYVLAPVPHLDSGTEWAKQAEPFRKAIAKQLDATVMPGFEAHVTTSFCTTPKDFEERLLSYKGAAFGLEPLLLQSAYFRPHNRSEDIEGLYVVGAGTHPGAGIPGVLTSAKALDSLIPQARSWVKA